MYDHWEKETVKLCTTGEEANHFIESKYFLNDYFDFFFEHSHAVSFFKKIAAYRHEFWLNHPLKEQKINRWLDDIKHFAMLTNAADNRLGLLKEFIWAKFSTLPLIISISTVLNKDFTQEMKQLKNIVEKMEASLKQPASPSSDLHLIEKKRLPTHAVEKINKQRFLNIYQIQLLTIKKKIFFETIETWCFNPSKTEVESIEICLPLSIGCVAKCRMCEFSLFKPLNIPKEALIQTIYSQIRNNDGVPFGRHPMYRFYYLGGGDALQYKNLLGLLTDVASSFHQPKQIISTIAFGKANAFQAFLGKIASVPHVDLQWSLNTFNETKRQELTGCQTLLPIPECIALLADYAQTTKRKVTVSLMLLVDFQNDFLVLKKHISTYLNPELFRLNFAQMHANHLVFSQQKICHSLQKNLYDWAITCGYEATIDAPSDKDDLLALCGRISSTVYNGNQPFLKNNA